MQAAERGGGVTAGYQRAHPPGSRQSAAPAGAHRASATLAAPSLRGGGGHARVIAMCTHASTHAHTHASQGKRAHQRPVATSAPGTCGRRAGGDGERALLVDSWGPPTPPVRAALPLPTHPPAPSGGSAHLSDESAVAQQRLTLRDQRLHRAPSGTQGLCRDAERRQGGSQEHQRRGAHRGNTAFRAAATFASCRGGGSALGCARARGGGSKGKGAGLGIDSPARRVHHMPGRQRRW